MADEQKPDPDVVRVKDLAAMVGTHFDDFLIAVRTRDGFAWKFSDPTWAVGAMARLQNVLADQTLIEHLENKSKEDDE